MHHFYQLCCLWARCSTHIQHLLTAFHTHTVNCRHLARKQSHRPVVHVSLWKPVAPVILRGDWWNISVWPDACLVTNVILSSSQHQSGLIAPFMTALLQWVQKTQQLVKVIWQKAASPPHMDGIPYTLHWATPSPKNCHFPRGICTPFNTWFLGSTRVHNPKGILIGSAIFAGLTSATDRPTNHATRSVTVGSIYVCSTAMWPNNNT